MAKHSIANALAVAPLAIGLIHQAVNPPHPASPAPQAKSGACALDLASCPTSGCANPASDPAHALVNQMKRRKPIGAVKALSFDDFVSLQTQADQLVGEDKELEKEDRDKLKDLKATSGFVSEGDLVRLKGFLIGNPHPNKGESVNCGLPTDPNNDFHIPMAADSGNSEFEGIVTEMIPQDRPAGWTLLKLRKLVSGGQQVLVTGQLFYDNMHRVNDDPEHDQGGQPKRFSLWEIHRITALGVCKLEDCDPAKSDDWTPLEEWKPPTHVTQVSPAPAPGTAGAPPAVPH